MTQYPKLSAKEFEQLPSAFKEIIRIDDQRPVVPDVIQFGDIKKYVNKIKQWNETRQRVIAGCARIVESMG